MVALFMCAAVVALPLAPVAEPRRNSVSTMLDAAMLSLPHRCRNIFYNSLQGRVRVRGRKRGTLI